MTLNALATTHIGKGNRNKWASCFLVNNSRTSNWKLQTGQDQVKKIQTSKTNSWFFFFFLQSILDHRFYPWKMTRPFKSMGKINILFQGYIKTNKAVAEVQQQAQNSRRFKIQLSEVLEWKIKVSVALKPKPTCCRSQRLQCICTT